MLADAVGEFESVGFGVGSVSSGFPSFADVADFFTPLDVAPSNSASLHETSKIMEVIKSGVIKKKFRIFSPHQFLARSYIGMKTCQSLYAKL